MSMELNYFALVLIGMAALSMLSLEVFLAIERSKSKTEQDRKP